MILEAYGIITGIGPAGGWHYIQPTPNGDERIPQRGRARNDDELVDLVRHYRVNNRLPVGDPAFDVAQYIRGRSPRNNRWRRLKRAEDLIRKVDQTPKNVPLIERIRDWLEALAPRRPKLVSRYDAAQRAEICRQCRQNVKWATKCKPCIERVVEMGQNLRQQVFFPEADDLQACRLHNLHLPSAVFVDQDHLPVQVADCPKDCWLAREQS